MYFLRFSCLGIAIALLFILFLSIDCNGQSASNQEASFLDLEGRDTTMAPADNFFLYANGNWLVQTDIPPSETGWGSFYILRDKTLANIHTLLDSLSQLQHLPQGSIEQKLNYFYRSGMDTTRIEEEGHNPIKPDLMRIAAINNIETLLTGLVTDITLGQNSLINFRADPDEKNSAVVAAHFDQPSLGLPSKDYYVKTDSTSKQIRQDYVQYIATLFQLTGDTFIKAKQNAVTVLRLETALANASKFPVELRIPDSNYYKVTISDLNKRTPNIRWDQVLKGLSICQDTILLGQPLFYQELNTMIGSVPLADWKKLLRFYVIHHNATFLSRPFVQAQFSFYGQKLAGQKIQKERWKTVLNTIDANFGEALGRLYVKSYFPPQAKKRMIELVTNLQQTYEERLRALDWMSDSTKQKSIYKLRAFIKKIGYPDQWTDYTPLIITHQSYLAAVRACRVFEFKRNVAKIGRPIDRTTWHMTPPTIDAYYNAQNNEIAFPAGILQPPFFSMNADDAVNYGGIGTAIGHEMTHGFDDEGRQYDAAGNLRNWWSPQDSARFIEKAKQVIDQYNHSKILDSLPVNGVLTLGENIADIGGLAIAYAAFKKTEQGKKNHTINGLTAEQRFFLSYAQIWRIKNTSNTARMRLNTDKHAPEMYRVNNPLSNLQPFYPAFDVKPGQNMYRSDVDRIHIW